MTTDPLNYILESIQTHLTSNVTDPRTSRDSSSNFVMIGNLLRDKYVQHPYILLSPDSIQTKYASTDSQINSTQSAETMSTQITMNVITDRDGVYSTNSRSKLCRNIGSQIKDALTKKSQKQTLKSSYDIIDVNHIGGGATPFLNQDSEWQMPIVFNVEFLYKYST